MDPAASCPRHLSRAAVVASALSRLRQTLGDRKCDEQLAAPSGIAGAIRGK